MIRTTLHVVAYNKQRPVSHSTPNPRHENLAVFQAYTQVVPPSLFDVQDALNVCKRMKHSDAEEYCYSVGVNYLNSILYYDTVDYLKRCYNKTKIR